MAISCKTNEFYSFKLGWYYYLTHKYLINLFDFFYISLKGGRLFAINDCNRLPFN